MEPGNEDLVTAMSIIVRAEITNYGHGLLKGELHSRYLEKPFEFISLLDMIDKMEEIFDIKCFPQKFLSPRTFGVAKSVGKKSDVGRDFAMNDINNQKKNDDSGGVKCTFEISVRFRQNATWQGQILWAEKNLKQNFRSVLEMLKLMDEALSDGDDFTHQVEWEDKNG